MFLDRLGTGLFDILKLDRTLTYPADHDLPLRRLALLEAITTMAHTLEMAITAEGIETERQCKPQST